MLEIHHKKAECIGCKLCADTAPQYFEMDDDGLAQLIGSRENRAFHIAPCFEEDSEDLQQCEEGCPVNIIRIRK